MKKLIIAALAFAPFLAGCNSGDGSIRTDIRGTVIEKDYDPTTYKYERECVYKYSTGRNKGKCAKYEDTKKVKEYENWDITVREPQGEEHEIDVSRELYDRINVGDSWPPVK